MNTKQGIIGTIVGGIVLFVLGYIIWDMLFAGFFAANSGSATGVDRDQQVLWAVALGSLAYAALIVYALALRAGSTTIVNGAVTGAIVGFLLWATADFTDYGVTNIRQPDRDDRGSVARARARGDHGRSARDARAETRVGPTSLSALSSS